MTEDDDQSRGWIGVDLDGTLAEYETFTHHTDIGKPIEKMVERVVSWLQDGEDVRIMTARADFTLQSYEDYLETLDAIRKWCKQHIGVVLPITNRKDRNMIELWDDRAVQVIPNTGMRADGQA